MISMDKALKIILENTGPLDIVPTDLSSAYNKVLAEDVRSDIDIPPFNKSAMDGYAVRARDLKHIPTTLNVVDNIPAGAMAEKTIQEGNCVKIMTGAPVPEGADTVVIVEDTESTPDGKVLIAERYDQGQNICVQGEDIKKGDIVLKRGTLVRGPEIATLASVGKSELMVVRTPTVGVLSTGNEIVEPESVLQFGQIRNSNGPMLTALTKAFGCDVEYLGIAGDEKTALRAAIQKGLKKDILLLSGGVSMGDYDLIPQILQKEAAHIIFHRVRVKPGKPLLFAKKGECRIFGIPGNPVSNFTTFHIFIKPAVFKMMGRDDYRQRSTDSVLSADYRNKSSRVHIVPSYCEFINGKVHVTPFALNGSADIIGCTRSNCLALIEENTKILKKGERVKLFFLDG